MYDWSGIDVPQAKERARELEELQKGMKKKINPKVLNMIDTLVFSFWIVNEIADHVQCGEERGRTEKEHANRRR